MPLSLYDKEHVGPEADSTCKTDMGLLPQTQSAFKPAQRLIGYTVKHNKRLIFVDAATTNDLSCDPNRYVQ